MKSGRYLWAGALVMALIISGGAIARLAADKRELEYRLSDNHLAQQLENVYEKSFYELTDHVRHIEVDLAKTRASYDPEMQQVYLMRIQMESEAALSDLGSLPFEQGTANKFMTFVNQVHDYCDYLHQSLVKNGKIEEKERRTLNELHRVSVDMEKSLTELSNKIGSEFRFTDEGAMDVEGNGLGRTITDWNDNALKYPEMIYDGPFSDSRNDNIKLDMPEITREAAEAKIKKDLSGLDVESVEFKSTLNNKLDVFCFNVTLKSGRVLFVQSTTRGGMISLIECDKNAGEKTEVSAGQAQETAKEFANKLGYKVEPVWVSKPQGTCMYVNLAPVINETIIYPDLVQVAVDETGICGFVGVDYLAEHKERTVEKPALDVEQVKSRLNPDMKVTNSNLAIVPKNDKEILCWEFECEMDGHQFYAFLDAKTGKEVDIFKVIKGTEGYSVM